VLEYNEGDITKLSNGSISAYNFIIDKIKALEITPAMLALEPCSGSLVVTDVKTGDVLALVTYPSYDNNKFAGKIDYDYYMQLYNDKSSPMINRPILQRTAPGSTFKMVTAFAALEEGVVTPEEKIRDLGIFDKVTPPAKCHIYPSSHGSVDIADALKVSCNYFFYEMGYRLSYDSGKFSEQTGLSKLAKYATLFGLNETSGLELDEAEPKISDKDSVRSSIGQGSNVYTPVQLARYITTLANRGTCYDLTLLDRIVDKEGKVHANTAKVNHTLANVSDTTWNAVYNGMYNVVNAPGGSVYNLYKDFGVTVAGKTGTSQISKVNPNNALFVSFAPYQDPQISVTAVIPNGYTSSNAAELSKDIYKVYFKLDDVDSILDSNATRPETTNSNGVTE
jgi:penicillin-binding protein 2